MFNSFGQVKKITIVLSGIALFLNVAVASYMLRTEVLHAHVLLKNQTDRFSIAVQESIKDNANLLASIETLYLQGNTPTAIDFSRIVTSLLPRNAALKAVEYVPIVKHADREAFELAKQEFAHNFQFTERAPSGRMMRANVRDVYYPIAYIEPLAQNFSALGFDLGSNASRKMALMHAIETGMPVLTAPQELVQSGALGLLLVHPIANRTITGTEAQTSTDARGWILGVFELEKMLISAGLPSIGPEIDVVFDDITDPSRPETLYPTETAQQQKHQGHKQDNSADEYSLFESVFSVLSGKELHVSLEPFEAYGRTYQIHAWASDAFVIKHLSFLPVASLIALWILAGLIVFILNSSNTQAEDVVEIIKRQTKELDESNRLLRQLSITDDLTGLSNKRHMAEFLHREWRHSLSNKSTFGVILLDLDGFSAFNAQYGYQAGDDALALVANALKVFLNPDTDLIARFGGEEYIVILPHAENAKQTAVSMVNAVAHLEIAHIKSVTSFHYLTASAGVGYFQASPNQTYESVLRRVDTALIEAKSRGRNQVFEIENYVSNDTDA